MIFNQSDSKCTVHYARIWSTYDIGMEEKFMKPNTNPKCSIGNKNMKEADHTRPNPFPITKHTTEIYAEEVFFTEMPAVSEILPTRRLKISSVELKPDLIF